VATAGIVYWVNGTPTVKNSPAPAGPVAEAPPAAPTPVDLSNPVPEIRVTSVVNAPAPIVVHEPAIRGRVMDEFDMPIEDAAVTIYDVETGPHRTFTGNDGGFAIGDLVAGRKYRVSAVKVRYNEAVDEDVAAPAGEVMLVLTGTSTAVGRVVDEFGEPVTRFDVVYLNHVVEDDALWREIVRSRATTWHEFENAEGRYEVAGVASDAPFSLGARAEGFEAAVIPAPAAPPGQHITLADIVLITEARIAGLVLSPKRAPVSGATVYLGPGTDSPVVARTDPSGRFVLSGLGEELVELTADHDAYLPSTIRLFPSRGDVASVEIVLGQGGALGGRVTHDGRAAPGQSVLVVRYTEPRTQEQVITGEDGRYRIEGLRTGDFDVLAKYTLPGDSGLLRIQSSVRIVAGTEATLNFDFPKKLGTLEGTVTVNGSPATSAEIKGLIDMPQGHATFNTTAGENGFYRIENILPGKVSIRVTARSNDAELRRGVDGEEVRGGETTRVDVDFDAKASLSGKVTNLAGAEVGQAFAYRGHDEVDVSTVEAIIRLESTKVGESDINDKGEFVISGLEPGDYTLVALVFRADAETGDDAINTIRVATQKTSLPATGSVNVTLTLSP